MDDGRLTDTHTQTLMVTVGMKILMIQISLGDVHGVL